MFAKDNWEQT